MEFHLNHTPVRAGFEIDHSHTVFFIGSCFAENIGNYFTEHQFKTCINPGGILFNPSSIATGLTAFIKNEPADETYLLNRDSLFLSYMHHSSIHAANKTELLQQVNTVNSEAHTALKASDVLIITFGSAFVYRHLQLNKIVANCHKQPGNTFDKILLSPDEIISTYTALINTLKAFNPKLKIIFTVSPVKYLKDGLVENNLSKAILTVSIHQIIKQHADCFYFPAYELVTDDLRDYRFYKKDLAHPNDLAIEYIWQKFSACFFSEQTQQVNILLENLNKARAHRPLTDESQTQAQLMEYIAKQKAKIQSIVPGLTL